MRLSASGKVSIVSNVVALVALGLAWQGWPDQAPFSYTTHKILHLIGVVIFAGNLVVGPLWVGLAWLQEGGAHLKFAVRTLVNADIWFTTPGLQLTVWNGLALASTLGGVQAHAWLVRSMGALLLTSVMAMVLVLPAQERLLAAVEADDAAAIRRAMVRWSVWGSLVGVPLALVFGWMILKQ